MLTKHRVEKTVRYCTGVLIDKGDIDTDYAEETVAACEEFAQSKFGVSLAELLFPTMPLVYQEYYAVNDPGFPEAEGPDFTWEKD